MRDIRTSLNSLKLNLENSMVFFQKNMIFYIFLLFILISSIDLSSQKSFARVWEGHVLAKRLNVRSGPGEGYQIVGKLLKGQKITAIDRIGRWVKIHRPDNSLSVKKTHKGNLAQEVWVHRAYIWLPKNFLLPAFGKAENKFIDWAIARGDLYEISIKGTDHLSISLAELINKEKAPKIAYEVACAYKDQLRLEEKVTVTVWGDKGTGEHWIAQITCP